MRALFVVLMLSLLPSRASATLTGARSGSTYDGAAVGPSTETTCAHRYRRRSWLPSIGFAVSRRWRLPARSLASGISRAGAQRARRESTLMVSLRWRSASRGARVLLACGLLGAAQPGLAQSAPTQQAAAASQAPFGSSSYPPLEAVLMRVLASTPAVEAEALLARARRAGALPSLVRFEVRVDDGRRWDTESRLQQDYDDASEFDGADTRDASGWIADRGVTARAQLGWDLSTLAWSGDELSILSSARAAEREQLLRITAATDAWLDLHAAHATLRGSDDADARLEASAVVARSIARLDVLTGGWFSRAFRAQN